MLALAVFLTLAAACTARECTRGMFLMSERLYIVSFPAALGREAETTTLTQTLTLPEGEARLELLGLVSDSLRGMCVLSLS